MKKYFAFLLFSFLLLAFFNHASAQSVLIVENPDTKPVPVKITNPTAPSQNKAPFTELSVTSGGSTRLGITASSNETKVIEYILANGTSATYMKITVGNRSFYVFIPPTAITINNGTTTKTTNTYSGTHNIVIKSGETYTFEINGSLGTNDISSFLVSGYTIK